MLSNKAKKAQQKAMEALRKMTKFDPNEMKFVMKVHQQACQRGMDEPIFKDKIHQLLHLTDEVMLERIFKVFDTDGDGVVCLEEWAVGLSTILRGNYREITDFGKPRSEEYVKAILGVVWNRTDYLKQHHKSGTQIEALRMARYASYKLVSKIHSNLAVTIFKPNCYKVYDLNGNGLITKDEIIYFLKDSFIQMEENEDTEEQVKVLAEALIKKMDYDKDGCITIEDFRQSVQADALLLEAFGPCLSHINVSLRLAYKDAPEDA